VESNTATAEQPEYLTVAEVSSRFRVSVPTIYRRCADGTLPHIRIGGDGPIRIPARQLEAVRPGRAGRWVPGRGSFAGADPAERRGISAGSGGCLPATILGCGHALVAFAGRRKPTARPLKLGPERTRSDVSDRLRSCSRW
jgi:excisionase family DNA binding protein